MGQILRNWRVTLAAFFSVAAIIGSYLLARGVESPPAAQASAESALLQAIAVRDSDGDGLSDWEEVLYGTSANATDTFLLGMTDGEAVAKGLIVPKAIADISVPASSPAEAGSDGLPPPAKEGTLTAAFAQNFFTLYLAAKQRAGGANLPESDMTDIANEALRSLSSAITAAPDFKSAKDLTISGSGTDAMKAFAADAEAVLLKNTGNATTSEIHYLKDAVEHGTTNPLVHIASIAKAYRNGAAGLAALPVPKELAADDLALINALMRMSEIATDFTRVNDDPLATMLALQQYPQATLTLANAFMHIGALYKAAGVSLPAGTPGVSFVNVIADIARGQQVIGKEP